MRAGGRGRRRGAAAIEFALVLPVFVLIFAAVMDFGWLFYERTVLDAATTRGCRAGALVDPGEDEADLDAVRTRAQEVMEETLLDVGGIACEGDDNCMVSVSAFGTMPGRSIKCVVDKRFEPILGMVLDPFVMESAMVVRLEWQRE